MGPFSSSGSEFSSAWSEPNGRKVGLAEATSLLPEMRPHRAPRVLARSSSYVRSSAESVLLYAIAPGDEWVALAIESPYVGRVCNPVKDGAFVCGN